MKEKKKTNVVIYTILMSIFFVLITEVGIWGYGGDFIVDAISNYSQGSLVISEAVLASLVVVVMLFFGNSYVFTEKKQRLGKGLFYGLFYIIGIIMFTLIYGVISGGLFVGVPVFNLALGCFLIGITEEFLCRGWLLNEFLERFGNTKKGVWYSIIISGLIFGLLHLGNVLNGQDLVSTITQVLNAAATGVVFGLIYYKTRNIWSVVILHGLWDFSLMLSTIVTLTQNQATTTTISIVSLLFTIIMILCELSNIIPYISNIDGEPKKGKVISCATIGFVLYIVFLLLESYVSINLGDTIYTYDSIKIDNYSITRSYYDEYYIKEDNYSFTLLYEDNKLVFKNDKTNYKFELPYTTLYDYTVMEEDDYYLIGYVDYINSNNVYLRYIYVYKNELSNSDSYMDELKTSSLKYLLFDASSLLVIYDRDNDKSYLTAYNQDKGYYLLTSPEDMAKLEN